MTLFFPKRDSGRVRDNYGGLWISHALNYLNMGKMIDWSITRRTLMIWGPRHIIFVTLYLLYPVSHNLVTLHDGVNVVRRKMHVTQSKEVWTICLPPFMLDSTTCFSVDLTGMPRCGRSEIISSLINWEVRQISSKLWKHIKVLIHIKETDEATMKCRQVVWRIAWIRSRRILKVAEERSKGR